MLGHFKCLYSSIVKIWIYLYIHFFEFEKEESIKLPKYQKLPGSVRSSPQPPGANKSWLCLVFGGEAVCLRIYYIKLDYQSKGIIPTQPSLVFETFQSITFCNLSFFKLMQKFYILFNINITYFSLVFNHSILFHILRLWLLRFLNLKIKIRS